MQSKVQQKLKCEDEPHIERVCIPTSHSYALNSSLVELYFSWFSTLNQLREALMITQ